MYQYLLRCHWSWTVWRGTNVVTKNYTKCKKSVELDFRSSKGRGSLTKGVFLMPFLYLWHSWFYLQSSDRLGRVSNSITEHVIRPIWIPETHSDVGKYSEVWKQDIFTGFHNGLMCVFIFGKRNASRFIFSSCRMLGQPDWADWDSDQGVVNTNWCDSVMLAATVLWHARLRLAVLVLLLLSSIHNMYTVWMLWRHVISSCRNHLVNV